MAGASTIADLRQGSPYVGYTYSYPHKTAYRPLSPARSLRRVWSGEDRHALFLYVHVPFCEMRCGFCNLFTTTGAGSDLVDDYLAALRRQAEVVAEQLGPAAFARFAIGGGTPTYLEPAALEELLAIGAAVFGVRGVDTPTSIETSPTTATPERLAVLSAHGVERISIGVQTFDEGEARALGRTQARSAVERALDDIRDHRFPTLNIDLMYGGEGQTASTWLAAIDRALQWQPEELYLYPLYVRHLTGLARRNRTWDDHRLDLYRRGRDHLVELGYDQVSMRMFRRAGAAATTPRAPEYCCQADGMIGLGSGSRSYTRRLHYSLEYAVGREKIRDLVRDYIQRSDELFAHADYGIELSREDRVRRFVLLSLLQCDGLEIADYRAEFGQEPWLDLPELSALADWGLLEIGSDVVRLTHAGIERSDAVGPWLYSANVRERMDTFDWR